MAQEPPVEGRLPIRHPVIIAAVVVLALNDHVFKAIAPGLVTGKLSDFAGLVCFPALLESILRLVDARGPYAGRRSVGPVGCAIATGLVFAAVKLQPGADHSDLVALPALAVPVWLGRRAAPRAARLVRSRDLVAIAMAGLVAAATSQAPTGVSVSASSPSQRFTLTAATPILVQPIAYRYATAASDPPIDRAVQVIQDFERWPDSCCVGPPPPLRFILVEDGRLAPFAVDPSGFDGNPNGGMLLFEDQHLEASQSDCPSGTCERHFELIWILDGDARGHGAEVEWLANATSFAAGSGVATPSTPSIEVDPAQPVATFAASIDDHRTGQVHLGPSSFHRAPGLFLTLSATAVDAMAAHPEWVNLRVRYTASLADRSSAPGVSLGFRGAGGDSIAGSGPDTTLFPFATCASGKDCSREVLLDFFSDGGKAVTIDWTADLTAAFPDLAAAPTGATVQIQDLCVVHPKECT